MTGEANAYAGYRRLAKHTCCAKRFKNLIHLRASAQPIRVEEIFDEVARVDLGLLEHAVPNGTATPDGYPDPH